MIILYPQGLNFRHINRMLANFWQYFREYLTHYNEITIGLAQYALVLDEDDGFSYITTTTSTTTTTTTTATGTTATSASTGSITTTSGAIKVICGLVSLTLWVRI